MPDAIDPAKAKCLVQSLGISDARLARVFAMKADPQLGRALVVLLQPRLSAERDRKNLTFAAMVDPDQG
jgi:hypothetical protein